MLMNGVIPPALLLRQGPVLVYDYRDVVIYAGRGGYGCAFTMEVAVRNDSYDKVVGVVFALWRSLVPADQVARRAGNGLCFCTSPLSIARWSAGREGLSSWVQLSITSSTRSLPR